jgi:maleate isomerase
MSSMSEWTIFQSNGGDGLGLRASIGLIGLATDRIGVWDVEQFLVSLDGVAVFSTRVPMANEGTPSTVKELSAHLATATELLVPGSKLDVVGLSCTSGSIAIGLPEVERLVRLARPGIPVSTPVGAALKAMRAFGVTRISLLAPYRVDLAEIVSSYFETEQIRIDSKATFNLSGDVEMSAVDPSEIRRAALACMAPTSDALFISCTGLRTSGLVDELERTLNRPVFTSNQALSWDCLRMSGVGDRIGSQGRLFREF